MNSPPNSLPHKPSSLFTTERLQLAIFLHASERLHFARCEPAQGAKVRFVFDDPEGIGAQAELEFDRGASCPATALFASQKFLRRKMTETLRGDPAIALPTKRDWSNL